MLQVVGAVNQQLDALAAVEHLLDRLLHHLLDPLELALDLLEARAVAAVGLGGRAQLGELALEALEEALQRQRFALRLLVPPPAPLEEGERRPGAQALLGAEEDDAARRRVAAEVEGVAVVVRERVRRAARQPLQDRRRDEAGVAVGRVHLRLDEVAARDGDVGQARG